MDAPGNPSAGAYGRAARRWLPNWSRACREVLRLVEEAVEDWQKMITRSEDTIEMLEDPEFIGDRAEQADLACELLSWLERQPLHLPRLPRVRRAE